MQNKSLKAPKSPILSGSFRIWQGEKLLKTAKKGITETNIETFSAKCKG